MKKQIIIGIIFVAVLVGVVVLVKMGDRDATTNTGNANIDYCKSIYKQGLDLEKGNAAAEIGEGEVKLTCENFKKEVEEYKGIVMVDMYSPTCPHCQKIGPVISEIAKEVKGKYKIAKLNVMAYTTVGTSYNIESVPALIYFKDGKEVDRQIGEKSKEEILTKLAEISK